MSQVGFRVVAIRKTVPSSLEEKIRRMGVEFLVADCQSDDEIARASSDADFVVTTFELYPFNRKVIESLAKCKFIETTTAGFDTVDVKAATEHGIGIINNPDYCTAELSDHVMALILACSRQIVQLNHVVKTGRAGTTIAGSGTMRRTRDQLMRLKGKTLGLIGFGRIARAVAIKASCFGMKTIYYDPYVNSIPLKLGVKKVSLDQLLEESDFVSIHAPLTPETKYLIGLKQLRKMKTRAYVINTARGSIINESDLYVALSEGYIAGAGLDATEPDPPRSDNPLLKLDNVVLTGHSGFFSPESWADMWDRPVAEIARVMRGEWPLGLVNPAVKEKYIQKWGLCAPH